MPVSTDDFVAICDLLGRYNWSVDEGDGESWASLFTPDGVFAGTKPEPIVGREALSQLATGSGAVNGPIRHQLANLCCDYAQSRDAITARYYNCVSHWADEGKFLVLSLVTTRFVRDGAGWLIERSDNVLLPRQG